MASDPAKFAEDVRTLANVGRLIGDFVSVLKRTTGGEAGLLAAWEELFGKTMPVPIGSVNIGTTKIRCYDREHFTVLYADGSGDIRRVPWSSQKDSGPPNLAAQLMASIGKRILGL